MVEGVAVKIRKRTFATLKAPRWEADFGMVNGKRLRRFFHTKKDASEWAEKTAKTIVRHGSSALELSEAGRLRFAEAERQLAAAGATIEEAVALLLAQRKKLSEPLSLADLLKRAALDLELRGKRPRYVSQFGVACRSFVAGREEQLAHTVVRDDVRSWVTGNQWSGKTQRGYLGDVRTLFSYGLEHGHVTSNPAAGKFPLAALDAVEIAALTAAQVEKLLRAAAHEPWTALWYVVLAAFCGIRPEELRRMKREEVSWEERHVVVQGKSSKTRQRRVIDVSENALAWLALDPCRTGPIVSSNFRLFWGRLRGEAGWRAPLESNRRGKGPAPSPGAPLWPHDALRHTFASMHYALHQNESLLKAQMGHSEKEDTLMQHYRALTTRREAEKFWALLP